MRYYEQAAKKKESFDIKDAENFAKQNGLYYYGEWSAFQNLNIKSSIKELVNEIYTKQIDLIKKGYVKPEGLKISYEQQNHESRKKKWWS